MRIDAVLMLIEFVIEKLTKSNKPNLKDWYDQDLEFGISIGEYCKSCHEQMHLNQGGFTGKPTLCPMCKISESRNNKLNQLDI